jgi:hypothetical protein
VHAWLLAAEPLVAVLPCTEPCAERRSVSCQKVLCCVSIAAEALLPMLRCTRHAVLQHVLVLHSCIRLPARVHSHCLVQCWRVSMCTLSVLLPCQTEAPVNVTHCVKCAARAGRGCNAPTVLRP